MKFVQYCNFVLFSLSSAFLSRPVTSSHPSFLPVPAFSSHSSYPLLSQPHPHLFPASLLPVAPPPLPVFCASSSSSSFHPVLVPTCFSLSSYSLLSQFSPPSLPVTPPTVPVCVPLSLPAPSPSSLCSHLYSPSLSSNRSQFPPSLPPSSSSYPSSLSSCPLLFHFPLKCFSVEVIAENKAFSRCRIFICSADIHFCGIN